MADTLDRPWATAYLNGWMGTLYTRAGIKTTDTDDGFAPPIDATWSRLGATPDVDGTILSSKQLAAEALLTAYAYRLVLNTLVTLYNSTIDAPNTRLESFQMYQGAVPLAKAAFDEAKRYGFGGRDAVYTELDISSRTDRVEDAARRAGMGSTTWTEYGGFDG